MSGDKQLSTLSKKHRLFVEAFTGDNLVEAMQVAGYYGAENYLKQKGNELLKQPIIIKAIDHRSKYIQTTNKAIATREDRQEFWSNIMNNKDPQARRELDKHGNPLPEEIKPNVPMQHRLKASELLGKSEADFIDRLDVDANLSLTDIVMNSYKPKNKEDDMSVEEIEAEYYRLKEDEDVDEEDDNDNDESEGDDASYSFL